MLGKIGKALTLVVLIAILPHAAYAADTSADFSLLSAYVWRGQVVNDEPVAQPSLTVGSRVGTGTLQFNLWTNFDLTDNLDTKGEFTEVDFTLSYGVKTGPVDLELGYIEYLFPFTPHGAHVEGTRELYLSATLSDVLLSPAATVYWDLDEAGTGSFYFNFGLGHSFQLADYVTLDPGITLAFASADYNEFYFGVDSAELNDSNASIGLSYTPSNNMVISGMLAYTWLWEDKIKDAAPKKDQLWGGVSLGLLF